MSRTINVNEVVLIKLNELGIDILRKQHNELKRHFSKMEDFTGPKVDENGYTRMQLWEAMSTFGPHIQLGYQVPFETEILLP